MDTSWYAVDAEGRVALFESSEDGAVPRGAADASIIWELWDIREPPAPGDKDRYEDPEMLASRLGLFLYEHAHELTSHDGCYGEDLAPYRQVVKPTVPIHIDQLPDDLREQCEAIRFPINFGNSPLLQPVEHLTCSYWGEKRGYLASDGQTICPIPWQKEEEDQFNAFLDQVCEDVKRQASDSLDKKTGQDAPPDQPRDL